MKKETTDKKPSSFSLVGLEKKLEEVFTGEKIPSIPENIKEIIVKYGPYLSLIGIVLSIPSLLALLGIGAFLSPLAVLGGVHYGFKTLLSFAVTLAIIIMEIIALPGLFKRQMKAWKIMFYVSLISVVSNLISFNIFSLIIGALISWYLLFQIKSCYKN